MQKCESCNTTFEPEKGLAEVTSLRILCPECQAKRRAERARKSGVHNDAAPEPRELPADAQTLRRPGATGNPAPAAPSVRAPASPAPGVKAPAAAAPSAKPSAAKAPEVKPPAAAPAKAAPRSPSENSHPSPAPSMSKAKEPAAAAPAAAPAAKATASALARKRLAEAAEERKRRSEQVLETGQRMRKKSAREVWIGFGSAILILVVAGVVLYMVLGKKQAEKAAEQARLDLIDGFRTDLAAFDISTVKGAEELIAFTESKKDYWSANLDLNSEVISRTSKAKTLIEVEGEKATITERYKAIQSELAKGAELTPSDLADLRRRLDELTAKAPLLGEAFVGELAAARTSAEAAHVASLFAGAEQAAAAEPLDRSALAVIQQAEDEIFKLFEGTYRVWQKDTQNPELTARKEEYESRYKAVIALSDTAVEKFFTPSVIEATPWRDLLAPAEAGHWKGASIKGFEFRVENGVMHLIGPAPDEKSEGIISIGDKEIWRDFVIDAEVTIVKGRCNVFFRLPPVWQENVESFELTTDEGHLIPDRSYEYSFQVLGSTLRDEQLGADSLGATLNDIQWTRVRKGAFGISVPTESEVKFTRLRIKILR